MKQWRNFLLGIVVSIVMLAYALHGVELDKLGSVLAQGRYIFVIPTIALMFLSLWARGVRWRALLDNRTTIGHSFNLLNVSYLFNAVLPLRLGEVVRAYLATRLDPPIALLTALSTVVVEQLTNVLAVVIIVLIAVFFTLGDISGGDTARQTIESGTLISAIVAVLGTIFLVVLAARRSLAHKLLNTVLKVLPFLERLNLRRLLDHTLDGIEPLTSPQRAGAVFLWTVIGWVSSVMQSYVLLLVFYDQPRWSGVLLFSAMLSLAVAVPAVPGNVGPFEAAIVFGLGAGGMIAAGDPSQQARALAFAVLMHVISVGMYAFLGVLGLGQEHISLGEVMRSARLLTARSKTQPEDGAEGVTENAPETATIQPVQPEG